MSTLSADLATFRRKHLKCMAGAAIAGGFVGAVYTGLALDWPWLCVAFSAAVGWGLVTATSFHTAHLMVLSIALRQRMQER
jgi:hypothetical protein